MRIGAVWVPSANAHYRALHPLQALARRGHQIVWPPNDGTASEQQLAECDVVLVYRRADDATRRAVGRLVRRGVPLVFDNDDDLRAIPKDSPDYKRFGGPMAQRLWTMSVQMSRMAHTVTTTNETLARVYRDAGAGRVEVIPNSVAPGLDRSPVAHEDVVVGWVAGIDHYVDERRLGVSRLLRRLQERHAELRVESIGVKLELRERYTHHKLVQFNDLPRHMARYDIGIAPLADLACNHARSDIKLKEYAASGVPWLASPVGPYRDLGTAQGGRLVADDAWEESLERLLSDPLERRRLGTRGRVWAHTHEIASAADHWERVLAEAAGQPVTAGSAPRPRMVVRLPQPPRA